MENIEMKTVIIWEQEFKIPANLSPSEEDEEIEKLAKPAAEAFLRDYITKMDKKMKETRGRKPKALTAEQEKAEQLLQERLNAPIHFYMGSKEFLDELRQDSDKNP